MVILLLGWYWWRFVVIQLLSQYIQLVGFVQRDRRQAVAIRGDKNRVLGRHEAGFDGNAIVAVLGRVLVRQLFRLVRKPGGGAVP
jgi:hypothetical protein